MTCKTIAAGPKVQIIECSGDMELAWILSVCAEQEAEYREWQDWVDQQMALDDQMTLRHREPEFWAHRADTDPDWPPPELQGTQMYYPQVFGP